MQEIFDNIRKQYLYYVPSNIANRKQFETDLYGDYDMSHFYKDVVRFTGQKVSQIND